MLSCDVVIIFFIDVVRRGTLSLNKPSINKQTELGSCKLGKAKIIWSPCYSGGQKLLCLQAVDRRSCSVLATLRLANVTLSFGQA